MNFRYIAFYKPYGVLCQFSPEDGQQTLADFNLPKEVYAAGRLDKDSEGLLILTNDGIFNQKVAAPNSHKKKTYWVQVENIAQEKQLKELQNGIVIQGYKTRPCQARIITPPNIPDRNPPIRERKSIPTSWIEIELTEGKNRQVRRMTAKVGLPTLRLIRVAIGKYQLTDLEPGQWKDITPQNVL